MTNKRHQLGPSVVIAMASTALAFGFTALQSQAPGDEPVNLFVCGCLMAALAGAFRLGNPILLGLASMAGFPLWAIVDLNLHGGHNLLPFEFGFYLVYGVLGVLVACTTTLLRIGLGKFIGRD